MMASFDGGDGTQVTSIATKRRIHLLAPIISRISSIAATNFAYARKYSKERRFWTEFLTPCVYIEKGVDEGHLQTLRDEHENLLRKVLDYLDSMIEMKDYVVAEEFASAVYPRLERLKQMILECDEITEEDSLTEPIGLSIPGSEERCRDLIHHLSRLAGLLTNDAEIPRLEKEAPTMQKRLISPSLLNMFSTLSRYWGCTSGRPPHRHQAALPLFTHKGTFPGADKISLTMFLSRWNSSHAWQETCVTIAEPSAKSSKVRIFLPETVQQRPAMMPSDGVKILDLCDALNKTGPSRLNLGVEGRLVFRTSVTAPEAHGVESGEMISLADGIVSNEMELDTKAKVCLALVLSYSVIDFCGEPWFPDGWSRDSIYLMQTNGNLSLRPHLVTSVKPASNYTTAQADAGAEIMLLHHGMLLMELFFQDPLELKVSPDQNYAEMQQKVQEHFDKRPADKWDSHERYRQAVQTCIMDGPRLFPPGLPLESADTFSQVVCKEIIAHLEVEFKAFWGHEDPDQVLSTLKLPGVKLDKACSRIKPKSTLKTLVAPKVLTKGASNIFRHSPSVKKRIHMPIRFFDVADIVDQREINGARAWFSHFERAQNAQPPSPLHVRGRRTRIAVLDTGIDLNNTWISTKRGRIRCWPDKGRCHDEEGHGTHVAYLILRLAPNVDLHIHKVSRSGFMKDADVSAIAKAITFSSTGANKVDMINLSFGFPQFREKLRPILDAIHVARNNDVLIFAAAGNEGGNQGTYWPAALETDVLQISASDSNGRPSGFSSDSGIRGRMFTLGEGVPSCQFNSKKETIHRSGTSFATPIAVAIDALVLKFVDSLQASMDSEALPEDFLELIPRIRRRTGMEMVLRKICVLQSIEQRSNGVYITPWHFLDVDAQTRVHLILNVLRNMPE